MFETLTGKSVLFWSSGLESTLLLHLLIESKKRFDIVQIRDFWTKGQKKKSDELIKSLGLKVFSYPPANRYFISGITMVSEIAVGDSYIPLLTDVIDGDGCIAELTEHRLYHPPLEWDTYIVGSRKDDNNYPFDKTIIPSERWEQGTTKFYAPLFDWTREDVKAELLARGLDATDADEQNDTGNLVMCHNCIKGTGKVYCPKDGKDIDSIVWDSNANLEAFKKAYG